MAKNKALELTIKIGGKIDKSLSTAIAQANGQLGGITSTFSRIGTIGLAAMGALSVGTVAAIYDCTRAAEAFEGQMADVVKYVDGLADTSGRISDIEAAETLGTVFDGNTYAENYEAMTGALLDLSTQIPMTAEDLTRLAAAAGQSGKGITDLIQYDENGQITGFLRDVAMMGTAMDISAEQAGNWAAKWEKAFNMNHDEIMVLSDQINYLGANSATTAAEIAEAVNGAASLGQIAGVDVATTAALADAMLATGVNSGRVATSIKRTFTNMSKGSGATKAMKEQWEELGFTAEGVALAMQEDSIGTLNAVFTAIGNLPEERQVAALSTLFGNWAIEGTAKVVGNMSTFTDALAMVSDPALYGGSMEREFIIKSSTTQAIDTMMGNARQALKIDFGTTMLPVKKQFSLLMIDMMNTLRKSMPELQELGGTLAELATKGVAALSEALPKVLPYIKQALDYVNNNGPQVAETIGRIAAVLVGMKLAPTIGGVLGGARSLLFGKSTGGGIGSLLGIGGTAAGGTRRTGGLFGGIANLWRGGQQAGAAAGGLLSAFGGASRGNGLFRTASVALSSLFSGNGIAGTTALLQAAAGSPGLISGYHGVGGVLANAVGGSGIARYFGNIGNSVSGLLQTKIGGGMLNIVKGTGGVTGEILKGISDATGLTGLAQGVGNAGRDMARWIGGKASGAMSTLVNSRAGQAVGGFIGKAAPVIGSIGSGTANIAGNLLSFGGAGMNVLGSVWGPMASGFGSLFAGAAPVIGVISGIIAVMSILGDHMEDIRGIIGNVFGEKGLKVFDFFAEKIGGIRDFIAGLFEPGAVTKMLAPLQDSITNLFGTDAGAAFGGVTTILESITGIIKQIVSFATTTVKPILEEVFRFITETALPVILQAFTSAAPYIAGIIDALGGAIMAGVQLIGKAIQYALPFIEGIISVLLSIGAVVIPAVLAAFEVFSQGIQSVVEAAKGIFDGLIQFITGVFSGDWKQAWEGVTKVFGNVLGGLSTLVKAPLNAVISLFNGVFDKIGSLKIPDWVPDWLGGGKELTMPHLPLLARGGFTNGPSIAGEAGQEAVISFLPGVRAANIATWLQAGRMLGADRLLEVGSHYRALDEIDTGDRTGAGAIYNFSVNVTVQGDASEDTVKDLRAYGAELEAVFRRLLREEQINAQRRAYR